MGTFDWAWKSKIAKPFYSLWGSAEQILVLNLINILNLFLYYSSRSILCWHVLFLVELNFNWLYWKYYVSRLSFISTPATVCRKDLGTKMWTLQKQMLLSSSPPLNHPVFNPLPSSLEVETTTTYCLKHEQETPLKYPKAIKYHFIENLTYFKSEQRDFWN